MPELFNILILVEDSSKLPTRQSLINSLLVSSSQWPTRLGEIMLLDFDSGKDEHSFWETSSNFLEQKLSSDQAMFVYSASSVNSMEIISSISFTEANNQSTICIAVRANQIALVSADTIQEWLTRLYKSVSSIVKCAVAAGSELEIESTGKTMAESAELLVSPFTNAFWVILPNDLLPESLGNIRVTTVFDTSSILCREFLPSWFHA